MSEHPAAPGVGQLLVVAGEASGDLHGAELIRCLRGQRPELEVFGVGGDRMRDAGAELLYHYRNLAVVGLTEVVAHLGDVRRAMGALQDAVRTRSVAGVVLIDYPDFNMTLARRLRRGHPAIPIVYYISPQVWAWRSGRVRQLARLVDRMLVILPFEKDLYAAEGVPVEFVGHPLLDAAPLAGSRESVAERHGLDPTRHWIGLLPGSRTAEVKRLLPDMVQAAALLMRHGQFEFVIPVTGSVDGAVYGAATEALPAPVRDRVRRLPGPARAVLPHCRAAVVCSGTATLETAIAGVPEVVVYRTSWLTYNLGKLLVRIRDIALVNVVGGRRGVPELLQGQVTPDNIVGALLPLLDDDTARRDSLRFLDEVRARLGEPGASERAARAVLRTIGSGRRESSAP